MLGFGGSAGVGAGANVLFGLDFKSTFVIRRIKLTEDAKKRIPPPEDAIGEHSQPNFLESPERTQLGTFRTG